MPKDLRRACFGYLVVVFVLFHRLLLGEVLHAGANVYEQVPFATVAPRNFEIHGNAIQGDAWRQHATWQRYQYEAARQGRFPFWNPYEYLGMPFFGNGQTALLHPFSWVYFLLDPNSVRGPLAAFRLWISAVACYALLRRWGWSGAGAFAAGCIWLTAPFNIRWLEWPLSNSSLWMPILILTLDWYLVKPKFRTFAVASLAAIGLQLAGHPETQFQAGVAAGCAVLIRLFTLEANWRQRFLRLLGCTLVMAFGVTGAAVQLLPFLVQVPTSADWIEKFHSAPNGLEIKAWPLFLAHDYFGRPRAGHPYEGPANYIEAGVGFGLLPLALFLTALFAAIAPRQFPAMQRKLVAGLAGFALLFTLILFAIPPLAQIMMSLPLFDQANRHRWILTIQFFAAGTAGAGVDLILRGNRRWVWISLALTLVLSSVLAWHLTGRVPARFSKIRTAFKEVEWRSICHHPAIRTSLGLVCVLGGALCIARRGTGGDGTKGLLFWLAMEGVVAAWDFNATAPRTLADPDPPPLLQQAIGLAGDGRLVATNEVLYPNLSTRYGFRDVSGYDWPLPMRLAVVLRKLGWRVVEGTSLPRTAVLPTPKPELLAFLSRSSVRVLYTDLRQPALPNPNGEPWPQVAAIPAADAIFVNPQAMPRARLAAKAVAGDEASALASLLHPKLDGPVVVEGGDIGLLSATGSANIVRDDPERFEIEVNASTKGLLVLADRMAPGWSVTVDSLTANPLTVDYLFRGVVVPAGSHKVVWRYEAPGYAAGFWMTGATLALLAVLACFPSMGNKKDLLSD